MNIEVQKKPQKEYSKDIQIKRSTDVLNLEEVKEIRNATQEHLILLGLDRSMNLRTVRLLGIGSSSGIFVDSKDVLRTALLTASDSVILVHNHPSNSLRSSAMDKELTNKVSKFLSIFNVNLMDHIIVTEENYLSMMNNKEIDKNYSDENTKFVDNVLLLEENEKLKNQIKELKNQKENVDMKKYESVLILKPQLSEEKLNGIIKDYKEMFEKISNKPVTVENMGKKNLAYEINGNKQGNYAIFYYNTSENNISDIQQHLRNDENVMKHITVRHNLENENENQAENDSEAMEDDDMEM